MLRQLNAFLDKPDTGKLLLRLAIGFMMLFHGVHKVMDGIGPIISIVESHGMPGFVAWGVYLGEVVAPVLLIMGLLVRPAALVMCFTMLFAWLSTDPGLIFTTTKVGGWGLEEIAFFFFGGVTIALLGGGRFSVASNPALR